MPKNIDIAMLRPAQESVTGTQTGVITYETRGLKIEIRLGDQAAGVVLSHQGEILDECQAVYPDLAEAMAGE